MKATSYATSQVSKGAACFKGMEFEQYITLRHYRWTGDVAAGRGARF